MHQSSLFLRPKAGSPRVQSGPFTLTGERMVEAALRSFQRDGLPVEADRQNQQKGFHMQIPGPKASLLDRNGKVGPRVLPLNASLLTGAQLWL